MKQEIRYSVNFISEKLLKHFTIYKKKEIKYPISVIQRSLIGVNEIFKQLILSASSILKR